MKRDEFPTAYDRFMRRIRSLAAYAGKPDYRLYEQYKNEFWNECPDASQAQVELAMRACAKAAGV